MKVTGVPYEQIAARGGGIASSARAFAAASRRGDPRPGADDRGRDAHDRHDDVRGQDRLRPLRTTPSAAPSASGRALGEQVEQTMAMTGLFAARRARRLDRGRVDGRGRAPRGHDRRRRARHLRRVRRVRQRAPRAARARSPPRAACRSARTSSSSRRTARCRSRSPPARARSTTSRACSRTTSARSRRARPPPSSSPAPSSSATRRSPPARALADAGAICVLGTDLNPGHVAGRVDPGDRRPRRPPLRVVGPRGAARVHAERGVRARHVAARSARSRPASAPT